MQVFNIEICFPTYCQIQPFMLINPWLYEYLSDKLNRTEDAVQMDNNNFQFCSLYFKRS